MPNGNSPKIRRLSLSQCLKLFCFFCATVSVYAVVTVAVKSLVVETLKVAVALVLTE